MQAGKYLCQPERRSLRAFVRWGVALGLLIGVAVVGLAADTPDVRPTDLASEDGPSEEIWIESNGTPPEPLPLSDAEARPLKTPGRPTLAPPKPSAEASVVEEFPSLRTPDLTDAAPLRSAQGIRVTASPRSNQVDSHAAERLETRRNRTPTAPVATETARTQSPQERIAKAAQPELPAKRPQVSQPKSPSSQRPTARKVSIYQVGAPSGAKDYPVDYAPSRTDVSDGKSATPSSPIPVPTGMRIPVMRIAEFARSGPRISVYGPKRSRGAAESVAVRPTSGKSTVDGEESLEEEVVKPSLDAAPRRRSPFGPFELVERIDEMSVVTRRSRLVETDTSILRTAVADSTICEVVQFTDRELSIIGKTPGSTHVTLWFDEPEHEPLTYLVSVLPRSAVQPEPPIKEEPTATDRRPVTVQSEPEPRPAETVQSEPVIQEAPARPAPTLRYPTGRSLSPDRKSAFLRDTPIVRSR